MRAAGGAVVTREQFVSGLAIGDIEERSGTVCRLLSLGDAKGAHRVLVNWRQECLDVAELLERYAEFCLDEFDNDQEL